MSKGAVLVTGASRGIGRATALRLAAEGYDILAHYGASRALAQSLADASPRPMRLLEADLSDVEGAVSLAKAVQDLCPQGLRGLIHSAAIAVRKTFAETSPEDLAAMLTVNVAAPYVLTQHLTPLLGDGARVVFMSSTAARRAFADLSAYAMTKAAMESLTISLAAELGPRGVRVNCIAPGAIETDMSPRLRTTDGAKAAMAAQAIKRVGQPQDVAGAITMLMSDDAAWITGAVLPVSGGAKL